MIGYDSDNLDDIPADAQLVLYYADNEPGSATSAQLARFSTPYKQSITRRYGIPAYWGDVEAGCLSISQGAAMFQQGLVSGLYVDSSDWPTLRAAIPSLIPKYWIAEYPFTYPSNPSIERDHPDWIPLGCVMWQFAGSPGTSPGHYDQSVTILGFPAPIPHPLPPPPVLATPAMWLGDNPDD
jgi:hypothetical protein